MIIPYIFLFFMCVLNITLAFSTPDSGIILDSISLMIGSVGIFIIAYNLFANIYDTYCTKDDGGKN